MTTVTFQRLPRLMTCAILALALIVGTSACAGTGPKGPFSYASATVTPIGAQASGTVPACSTSCSRNPQQPLNPSRQKP